MQMAGMSRLNCYDFSDTPRQTLDCGTLDRQAAYVPLHKYLEAALIRFLRLHNHAFFVGKYAVCQVLVERGAASVFSVTHLGSQDCRAPCAAFSGSFHDGHRYAGRRRHNPLSHALCLE